MKNTGRPVPYLSEAVKDYVCAFIQCGIVKIYKAAAKELEEKLLEDGTANDVTRVVMDEEQKRR